MSIPRRLPDEPDLQPQPEEVKTCPSSAHSMDGAASGLHAPTASIHPEGSNAAPQGSEPHAGAAKLSHAEFKDMLQMLGDGPQPQGGTPEVRRIWFVTPRTAASSEVSNGEESLGVHGNYLAHRIADMLNEARAALAAAQAEVERTNAIVPDGYRIAKDTLAERVQAMRDGLLAFQADRENLRAEAEALRKAFDDAAAANRTYREQAAELEQTRRELAELKDWKQEAERELLQAGKNIGELCQALTAAEQRADGAEKEKDGYRTALEQARLEIQILLSK